MMKVDKGVCTGNDAYFAGNTAANELNSIIKFETVFTTLVENKILAIKRDCEQHENKKKSRTLKAILSKKTEGKQQQDPVKEAVEHKKKSRKSFFLRHKNKQQTEVDVERGEKREDDVQLDVPSTDPADVVKVEVQNDKEQGVAKHGDEPAKLDSQPNENVNLSVYGENAADGKQNCDKTVANSQTEIAQLTLSTNNSSNGHSNKTLKESLSPPAQNNNEESSDTTIDLSLQQSSVIEQVKALPIDNEKSDLAICDDGVSSQNTSDIEFSLVSESISELPAGIRKKTATNSDPIVKKPAHFLSPPLKREVKVSERKAISCQSTPLFARHQKAQIKSDGEVKKVLTFQKELPKKVHEVKATERVKSQTIVIAPTSTTTTTTLAKPIAASGPIEIVHASRKSQKLSKYRDVSVEYEISYDDNNDANNSPRGFISSFNQLTSPPAAVTINSVTTNPRTQSLKQSKAQPAKEGRSQQEADEKTAKLHDIELELDDLAADVIKKKKQRRSKLETLADRHRTNNLSFSFKGTAVAALIPIFIQRQVGSSTVSSADLPISHCK